MKYQEAMEYINSCAGYGIVPGLDHIRELLRRLDNPQNQLKFIHISGTNGKGSTLAFVSTILAQHGFKTGRYVSPTIMEYRERFQIQGKPISKAEIGRLMKIVSVHADAMEKDNFSHPTPFEIETAMAFVLFAEKNCDFVVLETGMGGSLDATNIIENTLISVITGISRDHMGFLGETIEEIGAHKAGIMKANAIVVSAWQQEEVKAVLEKAAKEKEASELVFIEPNHIKDIKFTLAKTSFSYKNMKKINISLLGSYQIKNAALALEVILQLEKLGYSFQEEKIRKALENTTWNARFQVLDKNPYFIIDGAHNAEASRELRKSLQFYFTNKRIIYIIGVFRDKEYKKVIEETCDLAEHIITVAKKENSRALSALELAGEVAKINPMVTASDSVEEAVELSYLLADKNTVIVAFGSLAYLGDCVNAVKNRKKMGKDTHGQ